MWREARSLSHSPHLTTTAYVTPAVKRSQVSHTTAHVQKANYRKVRLVRSVTPPIHYIDESVKAAYEDASIATINVNRYFD